MRPLSFLAMCVGVLSGARPATLPEVESRCPAVTVSVEAVPVTCARVDGPRVGQLPLEVDVAGRAVRFVEWAQRDLEASEPIGFRVEASADVVFTVQAGDDVFSGGGGAWSHPAGVDGPRVHGIDAVTLCRIERPRGCVGPSVVLE